MRANDAVKWLRKRGGKRDTAEIAEALGVKPETASAILESLQSAGRIRSTRLGKYVCWYLPIWEQRSWQWNAESNPKVLGL